MESSTLKNIKDIVAHYGGTAASALLPEELQEFVRDRGGVDFKGLKGIISFAIPFPGAVIDQLQEGPSRTYLYYYNVVNAIIDSLAMRISSSLEEEGWNSFPIPASQRTGDKFQSIFPHRSAARLAGLGWIGLSCHIIVPGRGPRVRLGTVLTDAPLPEGKIMESGCGNCQACVQACPPGAIKGVPFLPQVPLEERFDPQACHNYKNRVRESFGRRVCGLCLAVCPEGQNLGLTRGRDNEIMFPSPGPGVLEGY